MLEQYLNLFVKSIFIENMVFAYFLGMCSYLAISKTLKNGVGMGFAVIFVLTITVPLNYLIFEYLLSDGALAWIGPEYAELDLSFLSLIMFIAVIASMVQLVEMIVEKFSPALYGSLGIFLPLIAVNCAILGGSLFMQIKDFSGVSSLLDKIVSPKLQIINNVATMAVAVVKKFPADLENIKLS